LRRAQKYLLSLYRLYALFEPKASEAKAAGFLVFFAANSTCFIRNSSLFRTKQLKFSLKIPKNQLASKSA